MTELARRFLLALRDQGYGFTFQDDDLVVLPTGGRAPWHFPGPLLTEPYLEGVFRVAIAEFAMFDGWFHWTWPEQDRREPGTN